MSQGPVNSPRNTVTVWIEQLKAGDAQAAQELWETYFQRMVELARQKLEGARRAAADEEDVALSAFKSFCLGARSGKFTQLIDRSNLWPLLVAITVNKSVDLIKHENRKKRGGTGHTPPAPQPGEPARPPELLRPQQVQLAELISHEPTPHFAAELSEQLERLLARLEETGDSRLGQIALLKMEGYSNSEIAESLGCVRRTIERKLHLIERLWAKDVA